jgi:hypothetical protein
MRQFALLSGDADYIMFGRAAALADACIYLRPEAGDLALPDGFPIGVGLINQGSGLKTCVFAHMPGAPEGLAVQPLPTLPIVEAFVLQAFGMIRPSWVESIVVIPINPPQLQLGPGDPLHVLSAVGSVGTDLSLPSQVGVPAFATAGHVAQKQFTQVFDAAGTVIGSVGFCSTPSGSGTNPVADFAVIDPIKGLAFRPTIPGSTNAGAGNIIYVGTGGAAVTIAAYCTYLAVPSVGGTLGEVYLTNKCITIPGDSGSVALLNGYVIGHVVGAIPGTSTLIQCIDYQLNSALSTYPGVTV